MPSVTVNTHEAKSRLSELLRRVESGDEVLLARNGVVVAKIIAWPVPHAVRAPGLWKGRIGYGDVDIVGSDLEIAALFDESAERG